MSSSSPSEAASLRRPSIHILDDTSVSRIAAGEVVERPASVVKELIENSVDAGATRIRVSIRGGGIAAIRVVDDGTGIPIDELQLAFARHATSKLATADDLQHVATMGFRGEALAAIASVSRVTVFTRPREAPTGARLVVAGGDMGPVEPAGAPEGTSILAEDLFYAVPARRKFLAAEATEASRIATLVGRLALASPGVGLGLERDGRTVFLAPGTGDPRAAAAAVWGRGVADDLLEVDERSAPVRVRGLVSPPHEHRGVRRHVALFVNGRWIEDRSLTFAVLQAYEGALPRGRFPLAAVFLEIPAADVDVNVHPAKTEVRLRHPDAVFATVRRGVMAALAGATVAPMGEGRALRRVTDVAPVSATTWRQPAFAGDLAALQGLLREGAPADERRLPPLRALGQVAATYIVAEGPDGLYLVDQHAAHERVAFERLLDEGRPMVSQGLLPAVSVDLGPARVAALEHLLPDLAAMGFDLDVFGASAVLVRGVPQILSGADAAGLVRDVVDAVLEGGRPAHDALRERAASAACKRASVKGGQALDTAEMSALLEALEATSAPRTCPHGRPTVLFLSRGRLEREFGRA